MPKRNRVLKGSAILLTAVATGCATPTPTNAPAGAQDATARGNAAGLISNNAGGLVSNNAGGLISNNAGGLISNNAGGLISNNAGGLISNNAGGLISNNAGGLISNNAGGLISNNAGGLISNNAGGLTGAVRGPAAGLISNNAGGLISNNAGGLISNNAGGLISNNAGGLISNNAGGLISNNAGGLISNNAGGLISNNAGGYKILQAEAAPAAAPEADLTASVPGAKVAVFNERDEMISYSWVTTDEDGNYIFTKLKASGPLLFVKAVYEVEGRRIELISCAPAPRKPGLVNVAVTPATTIVAKKFGQMVRLKAVNSAMLRPSTASKLATTLAPVLSARAIVAAAIFEPAKAADTFDNIMAEAPPAIVSEVREAASITPAVVADTPDQAFAEPPPPTAAEIAAVNAESPPNVDSGVDSPAPVAAADGGSPAAPTSTGGGTAPSGGGEAPAPAEASGGGATGGEAPAAGGGEAPAAGGGTTGGGATVVSNLKATIVTLGKPRSGKKIDAAPGTGNLFATSAGGLQTASASSLAATTLTFNDLGGAPSVTCHDGATRYDLEGGKISWSGGSVTLSGLDAGACTDMAVKGGFAYISSKNNNCVYKVDLSSGAASEFAGAPSVYGGMADGAGTGAAFNQPQGIVATSDALFVCDTFNRRIRKITYGGDVSTLAGGKLGGADGVGASAGFLTALDICADASGTLYVADQGGHKIRKVTQTGEVSTIAGTSSGGTVDGTGAAASLYFPTSIAIGKINGTDVLFVGQSDSKIRLISGM